MDASDHERGSTFFRRLPLPQRLIVYVPTDYVEAVGSATIGWAQLETAIDVLVAIAAPHSDESDGPASHSNKIERLTFVAKDELLNNEWRLGMTSLAQAALALREDLHNATHGTLYGRGVDGAALDLRMLYEKTHSSRLVSRMTQGKVEELAVEMTKQTRTAITLARSIAEASGFLARNENG